MTIRIFLCSLLLAFSASAQTLLPARQVSVVTNYWEFIAPTALTAQASFDFLDAAAAICPTNWNYLLGGTNDEPTVSAQETHDWLDANWGVPTSGWSNLSPTNRFGVPGETSLRDLANWLDANWVNDGSETRISPDRFSFVGVVATNYYAPATNAQLLADWLDNYGRYVCTTNWDRLGPSTWPTSYPWLDVSAPLEWLDSNAMWGTNIAHHTYSGGQWSDRRVLGFQAGRPAAAGYIATHHPTWTAFWYLDDVLIPGNTAVFDAGGTVSVAPFNEESGTFRVPDSGAWTVSGQCGFTFTNWTTNVTRLGLGFAYYPIDDSTPTDITLGQNFISVAPGEKFSGTISFSQAAILNTNYYLRLVTLCSAGWYTNYGPHVSSIFYSAFHMAK